MKTDLHTHSVFSDGLKTPEELCQLAEKCGVTHLALTDHDGCGGIARMRKAAEKLGLVFLPGAELSSGKSGHTHILVYGRVEDPAAQPALTAALQGRRKRAAQILALLEERGMVLPEETQNRLLANPGVGRAHIARALMDAGYVSTVQQAFDRYLENGGPCYVDRGLASASQVLDTLSGVPVLPVLAHPMETGLGENGIKELILFLIPHGLRGVEAFHPSATPAQGKMLEHFARENGLLVTGGSDFHGDPGARTRLGCTEHQWKQMENDTEALLQAVSAL